MNRLFTTLFYHQRAVGIIFSLFFLFVINAQAQTYNMGTAPATNGATINTCTGNFYDSGGSGGAYTDNQSYALTLHSNAGNQIKLTFSAFDTESGYDFLKVYDGTNTSGTLLLNTSGNTIPSPVTSTTGYLYIEFISDYSVTFSGWAASISCVSAGVPSATVGNYVWRDNNNNGLNDESSYLGMNGISVELWKETSAGSNVYTLDQSTITANDGSGNPGYYLFTVTTSANYKVKFPTTTGTNTLTTQTTTAGTDNNSDAAVGTGFSPVFVMNTAGTGLAKNNLTIDAGYYQDCNCAGNLLTNPSFETQNFTGWTLATNDPSPTSFVGDPSYAICGNYFAYFNPTSGNATDYVSYYQNVTASAGNTYSLTVFAGVHDPTKDHQLRLQFYNSSNVLLSGGQIVQVDNNVNVAPFSLIQYTLTATAPTGTAYARVTGYASGAWTSASVALKVDGFCLTNAPAGSLGNYVWTDTNADGIQNEPAANGLNGVSVELWNPGADNLVGGGDDVLITSTTTANNGGNPGYYNFSIPTSGNYYVKFPTSNNSNIITNRSWNINDDTDSNVDPTNGCSDIVTINLASTGFDKDNPTIDVGYTDCLTLSNLVVGTCTNVGGEAKVRVDITVNLPSPAIHSWDKTLEVSTGGQTYHFVSYRANHKVISFLLPANGQTDTIIAQIVPSSAVCNKKVKVVYTVPSNCLPSNCGVAGTLSGTVFKDVNSNGYRDAGETGVGSGVQNVTVTVFNNTGQVAQTTTDVNGKYNFSGLTNALTYRLEFSNYPAVWKPSQAGNSNGTSVQFVTTPSCTANFGLMYPSDYCQDNPYVLAGTYANGNPLVAGATNTGNLGWFHRWHYNEKDTVDRLTPNWGWQNHKTTIADSIFQGIQIGAVWGVAYNNKIKSAYTSAIVRRHAGFGPLGSGGIYKIDFSGTTPTIANWLNFDALGIPTGNSIINNTTRNLPSAPGVPNNDALAYDGVGKYSFGGLDISEDNNKLFVMNLYDQKLYIIDISGGGTPTLANITSIAVPQTSCTATNGTFRPWAVKYYHGKVYIGGVCSGETQPMQSGYVDMTGTVYSLDPSNIGAGFTQVYTFPLNYRWFTNWHSVFSNEWLSSPMFTDIEFDQDGSLIIGMLDRKGYQIGLNNFPPTGSNAISTQSSGDILRVHNDNGTFIMENNGISGPLVGMGTSDIEPLSAGRGFFDQSAPYGGAASGVPPAMSPSSQGGLALKPGTGEVLTTVADVINYNSGGVATMSTKNGQVNKAYELFYEYYGFGKMGKAAGIGDLELMCNAAPIEIGNYVWIDTDADGVQDPSEAGVQGVDVRLYSANFTLVGKTTTNIRGEYYFNMSNVDTTGVNVTTGAANTGYTGMAYNRQYYIVIGKNGQFSSLTSLLTMSGNNYGLTTANVGQGTNADWNDSDGDVANGINAAINGFPYIAFTSGSAGSSNHTYDFGFKAIGTVGNYVWNDTNGNGTQDEAASSGINGIKVHLWSVGADGAMGGGDDFILSTTTTANDASGNSGYYNFTIDINGTYYIQFPTANGNYILTTQTATAATDNNSDANTSTGLSPVFTINPAGSGTTKDNPTMDAGYKCPTGNCVPTSNRKVN